MTAKTARKPVAKLPARKAAPIHSAKRVAGLPVREPKSAAPESKRLVVIDEVDGSVTAGGRALPPAEAAAAKESAAQHSAEARKAVEEKRPAAKKEASKRDPKTTLVGVANAAIVAGASDLAVLAALIPLGLTPDRAHYPAAYRSRAVAAGLITKEFAIDHTKPRVPSDEATAREVFAALKAGETVNAISEKLAVQAKLKKAPAAKPAAPVAPPEPAKRTAKKSGEARA